MLWLRRHKSVSDPVAVVNRFVDAANRHDAEGIARCLHPDFESIQPVYPSRNFQGSDQVRRNWQAIFQSEPGFRLSLVRSSATDGTVWVELHGAGSTVEVAGVFIMGVEENLVRWARVYSAVVEQPAPVVEEAVKAPNLTVVAPSRQDEAEELRRMIEAGREAAGMTADDVGLEHEVHGAETVAGDGVAADLGDDADAGGDLGDDADAASGLEAEGEGDIEAVADEAATNSGADADDPEAEGEAVAAAVEGSEESGPGPVTATVETAEAPGESASTPMADDVSTEVRAAVAEVQALAENMAPRRSRNRRRTTRVGDGQPGSTPKPGDGAAQPEAVEVDDAARVRAAARAATSKAAAKTPSRKPRSNPGGKSSR